MPGSAVHNHQTHHLLWLFAIARYLDVLGSFEMNLNLFLRGGRRPPQPINLNAWRPPQ
jgi:hypothetical protein